MKHAKTALLAAAALSALAACELPNNKPKVGTLNRNLLLVDEAGTRYGHVEMNPVSGGRLFDSTGALIGTIVTPAVTSSVTTVTPVVTPMAPQPYPVQ